jgi:hypothetical protein
LGLSLLQGLDQIQRGVKQNTLVVARQARDPSVCGWRQHPTSHTLETPQKPGWFSFALQVGCSRVWARAEYETIQRIALLFVNAKTASK